MTDEEIRQAYNQFPPEGRDLLFEDFKKAIKDLTDPVKIQQDLAEIEMQKAIFNTNKIRIDKTLN